MYQNRVAFLAIINNQDQPIYMKNFLSNNENDIQFQLYSFTALEMIELQIKKKLAQNSALSSYVGLLTNIYLSEGEYDVYGYCSATKTRIIVILTQKLNTEAYNENTLKQFFKTIHEVYLQDLFNPFHDIRNGLSEYFQPKLNKAIELYEKAL